MVNYVYDQTLLVKRNVNNALSELNSLEKLFEKSFNIDDKIFNKTSITDAENQLYDALYYLNYTVLPTALKSPEL